MAKQYYRDQFPNLVVGGAWFHQDWNYVHPCADDALRAWIHNETIESRKHVARELAEFLALDVGDAQFNETVWFDLGLEYVPTADGWPSMRAWLYHVLDEFGRSLPEGNDDVNPNTIPPE